MCLEKNAHQCQLVSFSVCNPPPWPRRPPTPAQCYLQTLCTVLMIPVWSVSQLLPSRKDLFRFISLHSWPCFLFRWENRLNQRISACSHQPIYLPSCIDIHTGSLPSCPCGQLVCSPNHSQPLCFCAHSIPPYLLKDIVPAIVPSLSFSLSFLLSIGSFLAP